MKHSLGYNNNVRAFRQLHLGGENLTDTCEAHIPIMTGDRSKCIILSNLLENFLQIEQKISPTFWCD